MHSLRFSTSVFPYWEMHDRYEAREFHAKMFGISASSLRTTAGREAFRLWLNEALFIALAGLRRLPGKGNVAAAQVAAGVQKNLDEFAFMKLDEWSAVDAAEYILEAEGATLPRSVHENATRGAFRERARRSRYFMSL